MLKNSVVYYEAIIKSSTLLRKKVRGELSPFQSTGNVIRLRQKSFCFVEYVAFYKLMVHFYKTFYKLMQRMVQPA